LSDETGNQLVLLDRLRDTTLQVALEKHGESVVVKSMKKEEGGALAQLLYPGRNHMQQRHRPGTVPAPPSISMFRSNAYTDLDLVVNISGPCVHNNTHHYYHWQWVRRLLGTGRLPRPSTGRILKTVRETNAKMMQLQVGETDMIQVSSWRLSLDRSIGRRYAGPDCTHVRFLL
jgi:hypothetical protein